MIVGFTGTQFGMNHKQRTNLRSYFKKCASTITEFHHGDCVGADVEANDIARTFGIKTAGHPPIIPGKRAYSTCDIWFPAKQYLERNQDIVDICDTLIVAPRVNTELIRSGTWATYRDAIAIGRDIVMLER